MKRSLVLALLSRAEAQVVGSNACVTSQRDLIHQLRAQGRDTSEAEAFLDELQRIHARCIFNRDRLLIELDDSLDMDSEAI